MDLKQLILEGESETLEFKQSTGEWKEIIKSISVFANTRVGKSTVRMSKDEYERSILEKHKEELQFDSQVCTEAGLKDINRERINKCSSFIIWQKSSKILFTNSNKSD